MKRTLSTADSNETVAVDGRKKKLVKRSAVDESRETNDNTKTWTVDTAALSQKKSLSDSLPSTPDDSGYATTSGLQPGSNSYISDSECGLFIGSTSSISSPEKVSPGKKSLLSLTPKNLDSFLSERFVKIKEEVSLSGIADILLSKDIITEIDVEKIREEKYRPDKCDILIKAIARGAKANDLNTSREVVDAFCTEGYDYLFTNIDSGKEISKPENKEIDRDVVKSRFYLNSNDLEKELDPVLFLDDLVAAGVLTLVEHEDIYRTNFKPEKIQSIIKYIIRKPASTFWTFCNVIQKEYPNLANRLRDGSSVEQMSAIDIEVSLTKGPTKTILTEMDSSNAVFSGMTEVKFTFGEDGREEEAMIVDECNECVNVDLQEEAMEDGFDINSIQFSSIRIHLSSMSGRSQMEFVKKCQKSPIFLKEWLKSIMTEDRIERLKKKDINRVTFEIKICLPLPEESSCQCLLSKEAIVNHFSSIEKDMNHIDEMIGAFIKFEGFENSETKRSFESILKEKDANNKTGMFLRKVLDMNQAGNVQICLMEREMRRLNPELFNRISRKCKEQSPKENAISPKDIRQNMSLLLNELEPRHYQDMLRSIEGSENVVEKVMTTNPRRERCREMLNYIVKQGKSAVDKLVQELVRNKQSHILEILNAPDDEDDNTVIREAVARNYRLITEEIEPRLLRQIFVDRREILAKDIDGICKLPKRKERAVQLVMFIQSSKESVQKCFLDAIELAGYKTVFRILKEDIESYKECPRIFSSSFGHQREIRITGELQLEFKKEIIRESPLQVFLHRSILRNDEKEEFIDDPLNDSGMFRQSTAEISTKSQRTREWIEEQQECSKRVRNNLDIIGDGVSEGKRFCEFPESDSPSPSYKSFISARYDELRDICSQSPSSEHTASRGSLATSYYEDISPPSSPGGEDIDRPHKIIEAPCSPISIDIQRQDSDSSAGYLSQPAPCCQDTSKPIEAPIDLNSLRTESVSGITRFTNKCIEFLPTKLVCFAKKQVHGVIAFIGENIVDSELAKLYRDKGGSEQNH